MILETIKTSTFNQHDDDGDVPGRRRSNVPLGIFLFFLPTREGRSKSVSVQTVNAHRVVARRRLCLARTVPNKPTNSGGIRAVAGFHGSLLYLQFNKENPRHSRDTTFFRVVIWVVISTKVQHGRVRIRRRRL